jgi:lipoprotein-releasing system ATP-binding protein
MNDASVVLSCNNLAKNYVDGDLIVPVLKSIDLSVMAGEMVAITGASGTGKSTLLHLLGGLDHISAGEVEWMGHKVSGLSDNFRCRLRNKFLGFVYQFHHLLPEFNVLENTAMPLWIAGISVHESRERSVLLLERVGLSHRLEHRVGELSGGERQRVAIARALIMQPAVVLADEPTGNLDTKTAQQVFELMRELNEVLHISFVMVTHNDTMAKKLDRCLIVESGELRQAW